MGLNRGKIIIARDASLNVRNIIGVFPEINTFRDANDRFQIIEIRIRYDDHLQHRQHRDLLGQVYGPRSNFHEFVQVVEVDEVEEHTYGTSFTGDSKSANELVICQTKLTDECG